MGLLSPPSVEAVRARRWPVFIIAILENMLFAAPLFGWASLRQMLLSFGWQSEACIDACKDFDEIEWERNFRSSLSDTSAPTLEEYDSMTGSEKLAKWNPNHCDASYFPSGTYNVSYWSQHTDKDEWVMKCDRQAEILNLYFTIGTSCLSGSTMLYGLIMDKYGCRLLRLGGMAAFAISCVFFSLAASQPRSLGWIVLPAVLCNGMGGILYIFTGFQLANFFPGGRSTVCALLIGSYNASALVYPILFEFFKRDILSFYGCMYLHMALAVITFIEGWIDTPAEPIPEPSAGDENNENKEEADDEEIPSFMSVLFSIPCILSLVTMCITVLRLSMYIGQMELWFKNAALLNGYTEENAIKEIIEKNAMTFGFIQILCVVWAVPIGYVLDRKLTECKKNPKKQLVADDSRLDTELDPLFKKVAETNEDDSGNTYERVQKLRNTRDAYIITVVSLMVFGALMLLQSAMKIQVLTFVLHTVIRTFIHSSAAGIYVNVFHMSHIGKLTGLGSIAGAIFSLIMDPLMKLVNGPLEGNPYMLNVVLLFASALGGLLPIYLHWFANKTEKEYKSLEQKQNSNNNNK